MDLSLVIPTKNEAGNIGELIGRARALFERMGVEAEIVTVDGHSADGTCEEAEGAGARVHRDGGASYGEALRTGFADARGDYIITMDSDLSHAPEFIADLWARRDEADIVIASRYVPGGQAEMALTRAILSRILNVTFITILQVPVLDISSGFRLYRREALGRIAFTARDFDVLEEILIRLFVTGHTIREVPFHYRPRKEGKSNAKLIRFGIAYLKTLTKMIRLRWGSGAARESHRKTDERP
jgi:dolichol-phosphate mannosyltransferase